MKEDVEMKKEEIKNSFDKVKASMSDLVEKRDNLNQQIKASNQKLIELRGAYTALTSLVPDPEPEPEEESEEEVKEEDAETEGEDK